MFVIEFLKTLRSKKRGGPILEEILLIGIAIIIFAIIFGIIMSLIDWSAVKFDDIFG